MTERNQKIFNEMIKKLEEQRLKLFRSAAQLDETIRDLGTLDLTVDESIIKHFINSRMTYRESVICATALPRDELSSMIIREALNNIE